MAKAILKGAEAHQALLRGMELVVVPVGSTLGPRSGTVVLGRPMGQALITKDGVTVAESISVADPFENEGVKLIQEAARKTNQEAGDGTTAATILTHAIFREGVKVVASGANAMSVERGIQKAVYVVTEELAKLATPIDQTNLDAIRDIATISANSDEEMGDVIARAVQAVGLEGVVMVDTSPTLETTLTLSEGLQFEQGFISHHFMNDRGRGNATVLEANVFVTDRRLIDGKQMIAFLQNYVKMFSTAPLLLIAADIAEGAMQILAANNGRTCNVVPVKAPGSGESKKEELEDIALWTGAKAFTIATGSDILNATKDDFGTCERAVVSFRTTTIMKGGGAKIRVETRRDELRSRIADPKIAEYEKSQLERRLAVLSSSVAIIKIGSSVHSKLLEKRDRVEDSVNATKAALKEGIVPGGGVALIRCLPDLQTFIDLTDFHDQDEKIGAQIVARAITAPLHRLATNSGKSGDVVVEKVIAGHPAIEDRDYGYNAAADRYEFLVAAGIVDPAKVVRLSLQNAAELSGLLLTASTLVVEMPEPVQSHPPAPR